MPEVKWIKLAADIFDNRKIKQIESLPDGDAVIVIWMKLLCLAGNINDSGLIYFTKEIPYTEQMLATQFKRPLATIQMAMKIFENFGMIEIIDNILHISNWEKYQSVDKLADIREYNKLAKQKSRAKQKLLSNTNNMSKNVNDMSMTCQPCQGIDIDIDKDIDINNNIINNTSEKVGKFFKKPTIQELQDYCKVKDYVNIDCVSFWNFYESKNWMIGKNKMTSWKAALATWNRNKSNTNNSCKQKRTAPIPEWYVEDKKNEVSNVEVSDELKDIAKKLFDD